MKASSFDASEDGDAETKELDYCELFSVLMYYGHMSKEDIMCSSRPFLYGIYRQYAKRACENLGISSKEDDEEENTALSEMDYPSEFIKIPPRKNETIDKFKGTDDFLSQFSQYNPDKFKGSQFIQA